jgi:DNA-binding response OmpR family regulator
MSSVVELGNLKIDALAFKVFLNQNVIDLTLIEMRMLSVLLRSFPLAVTKKVMLKNIWGFEADIKAGTINTHLTNLRNKIEGWNYSIKVKEENIFIQQN